MNEQPLTWDDVFAMWDELRETSRRLLAKEGRAQSILPTDLVLTALRRQKPGGWSEGKFDEVEVTWENRAHFFGQMNRAMVQALAERGRRRKRVRQIKTVRLDRFEPDDFRERAGKQPERVEALAQALEQLRVLHPDWAELIEHMFFEGLSQEEAAEMLEIDPRTARRWFDRARVLLEQEVNEILGNGV